MGLAQTMLHFKWAMKTLNILPYDYYTGLAQVVRSTRREAGQLDFCDIEQVIRERNTAMAIYRLDGVCKDLQLISAEGIYQDWSKTLFELRGWR